MITYKTGNLLDDDADALVNAVNCVGIMGGGIALAFARRWPKMYSVYRYDCEIDDVVPGKLNVITKETTLDDQPDIINFVTKDRPQNPSRLDFIEDGLKDFLVRQPEFGWKSVAWCRLGCGLGGLDYTDVKPLMLRYLEQADCENRIYE